MKRVNLCLNALFWAGWLAFLGYVVFTFYRHYTLLGSSEVFQIQYQFYVGILIWSALYMVCPKYIQPCVWLVCLVCVMELLYWLPEIALYIDVSICFDDGFCEELLEKGILKLENGRYVYQNPFN